MTKEQLIYKNMKKRGRIFKAYGKWGIPYHSLFLAIKEAGYNDDKTIKTIIKRMIDKGYIRKTHNNLEDFYIGNYIILKWVN